MFDNGNESDRPPTLEERYHLAGNTVQDDGRGPGHLRVAAGIAAREEDNGVRPSIALGHALARLRSEWHGTEKPTHHQPKSIRQWIDLLPLIQTGERVVKGKKVPVMSRDKDGARAQQGEERARLDALYEQELKFLAQRLPSRLAVRSKLYAIAIQWGWDDADERVAALVKHWVDGNCKVCDGTGSIMVAEKPQTCTACGGREPPVPGGHEGYLMYDHMKSAHARWIDRLKTTSRTIHRGA